jgi:hypothetical protein
MKKKLLIGILVSSLFVTNSNAGAIDFAIKHPIVTAVGVGYGTYLLNKSTKETIEYFKDHPKEAPRYFNQYPDKYSNFKNSLLNLLSKENNPNLYNSYRKLAETMGFDNIPGFNPQVNNLPVLHQNPIQNQNSNDFLYDNPINPVEQYNIIIDPQNPNHIIDTSTEFPIERPQSWEDYLLLLQNSTILGYNLDDWYKISDPNWERPDDVAAHHLIPATDKASQKARDILEKYGIDINNAVNGVYLPNSKNNNGIQGIEHNGRHPQSYAKKVNELIEKADTQGGKQEVIKTLTDIKNKLQNAPRNTNWRNVL